MKHLASSSEVYYIKAADLKKLSVTHLDGAGKFKNLAQVVLFFNNDGHIFLVQGKEVLASVPDDKFIDTSILYYSHPALLNLFINMIKNIKRKFYLKSTEIFTVRLSDLSAAKLPRGERNEENAYQLKRYHLSQEEAKKCYQDLRQSLKMNGYKNDKPMFVMLNRKFGIKDQLLQGHHRFGLCRELGIEEVTVSFWAAPASFTFLRFFL